MRKQAHAKAALLSFGEAERGFPQVINILSLDLFQEGFSVECVQTHTRFGETCEARFSGFGKNYKKYT
ncbi:MAG: hypothetical protein K0S76_1424 [Herbinix sp.]|nr:hypothetical protein [Herbinix sp.]